MRVTNKQIQKAIKAQYGIDGVHAVHNRNLLGGIVNFQQLLTHDMENGRQLRVKDGQNINIFPIAKLSDKTVEEWVDLFGERMEVDNSFSNTVNALGSI